MTIVVSDFLVSAPALEAIVAFNLPETFEERALKLLSRHRSGELTPEERAELDEFSRRGHFMIRVKLQVRLKLAEQACVIFPLCRAVHERTRGCCEYCLLSRENHSLPFEIDHIILEKHRGIRESNNYMLTRIPVQRVRNQRTYRPRSREKTLLRASAQELREQDMSYLQIAKALGISVGTAWNLTHQL